MNKLEQLLKLRLAPSPVHGIGVFATRDIRKGEQLFADAFPKKFEVKPSDVPQEILERHPYIVTKSFLIYPDVRFIAYMNHSEEPNYDAFKDIALSDIKKGEEVTEDYRVIESYPLVFPWLI